ELLSSTTPMRWHRPHLRGPCSRCAEAAGSVGGMRTFVPVVALATLLAGCTAAPAPAPNETVPTSEMDGVQPAGVPTDGVTGLTSPWSVITYEGESGDPVTLVSQRDDGAVLILHPSSSGPKGSRTPQVIGTVPGVVHQGEGGLLGLAHLRSDRSWL